MDPSTIIGLVVGLLGAIGAGTWASSLFLRRQYRAAVRGLNATARTDEASAQKTEAEVMQLLGGAAAESVKWATQQLTEARKDLVSSREDHERDQGRIQVLEQRLNRIDDEREAHRELLATHSAVDFLLTERLREAGIDISDLLPLPPLLLPHH